jgi:Ring finger domain
VIQESDIYYGYEKPISGTNTTAPSEHKANYSDEENKSSSTSLKGEEDDIEIPQYPRRISDCGTIDSKPPSWIKVVSSFHQSSSSDDIRYVEGNCSICLLEFEVGDIFISSTRRACIHGFHQDCALTWLSTGKKRCPVCRNYFVPRSRIDDVDVVHHRDDDMEAYRIHNQTSSLHDIDPLQQAITFEGLVLDDDDQDREDPLRASQISSVLSTSMDHVIDRLDQSVNSDGTRRSGRGRTYCQIHPL